MKNFKLFLLACFITVILTIIGIPYNIGKSLLTKGIANILKYWLNFFVQVYHAFRYLFSRIFRQNFWFTLAFFQDLMWNVVAGEFLEDIFTWEEVTAYGMGQVSVSGATGRQELRGKLTLKGKWFSKLLDKFFKEYKHCINAWNLIKDRISIK